MSPDRVTRLFGPPPVTEGFRTSETWWYTELGVRVYFPQGVTPRGNPVIRVRGGIF
jgi:hypothetical protein